MKRFLLTDGTKYDETLLGIQIGRAIARDVLADDLPREWTGLEPQDVDQIPEGLDRTAVEAAARDAYEERISAQ